MGEVYADLHQPRSLPFRPSVQFAGHHGSLHQICRTTIEDECRFQHHLGRTAFHGSDDAAGDIVRTRSDTVAVAALATRQKVHSLAGGVRVPFGLVAQYVLGVGGGRPCDPGQPPGDEPVQRRALGVAGQQIGDGLGHGRQPVQQTRFHCRKFRRFNADAPCKTAVMARGEVAFQLAVERRLNCLAIGLRQ